jgi:hypothetical protein
MFAAYKLVYHKPRNRSFLVLPHFPVNCATKTELMNLKLYSAVALLAAVSLASCAGDDNKEYVDKSIMPTAEEKAASEKAAAQKAALNATMPNQTVMPGNIVPGQTTMPVTMPQNVAGNPQMVMQAPPPTVTPPGMNPPHGQPGHRCDIAVGAPLNSKPAAPATTTGTTVNGQPQVTMTEVPTKVKTLPGMNPPHGEPGHRCDIAVGAPLNSKPATPTTVTTSTAPASIAPPPLLTTPKTDSTKN